MQYKLLKSILVFYLWPGLSLVKAQTQKERTVTDIDGNKYQTITIGSQVWMKENLKTTRYNDGTEIHLVPEPAEWADLSTPAYSWQNNDESNYKSIYGALYNWYVVETGKLCPAGWHVPTDDDWENLEIALGMSPTDAANEGWRGGNIGSQLAGSENMWVKGSLKNDPGFDKSGFNGIPAGNRIGANGSFGNVGTNCYWWSATEENENNARTRNLYYGSNVVIKSPFNKKYGVSARCVKDE